MTIWIDAQISPAIAAWIRTHFAVNAVAVRDLGLRDAVDQEIFLAAKRECCCDDQRQRFRVVAG